MQHLIRTDDFTVEEIEDILADAQTFSDGRFDRILQDKIIITLFLKTLQEQRVLLKLQQKDWVQIWFILMLLKVLQKKVKL